MTFHDWLQKTILEKNIDPRKLAKLSGIPKHQIDSFRKGDILPTRYQIDRIAKTLDVGVDEIPAFPGSKSKIDPVRKHELSIGNGHKIDKPGLKKKESKIKNSAPRLHDIEIPKERHCWICNLPDDQTCYYHHCEVPYYKIKYGSGTAKKIDDRLTVWGHHKCGTELSIQLAKDAPEIEHLKYEIAWSRLIIENKYLLL